MSDGIGDSIVSIVIMVIVLLGFYAIFHVSQRDGYMRGQIDAIEGKMMYNKVSTFKYEPIKKGYLGE